MALAYVPITLTNNESTATGTGFQQLIQNIDMRAYTPFLNADLSNVYFSSDSAGSTVINSWIESGNTNTSTDTTLWAVTSIAANSTTTIYMQVDLAGTNHLNTTTTGVAPQLTGTYAEYDNGGNVFSYYQAWGGLSALPSGWTNSGATLTFNPTNINIALASGISGIYENSPYSSTNVPFVMDWYGITGATDVNDWIGLDNVNNNANFEGILVASNIYSFVAADNGVSDGNKIGATPTSDTIFNNYYVSTSNFEAGINYNVPISNTGTQDAYTYFTFIGESSGTMTVYWTRFRAYPPSGVMPSVSFGTPSGFPYVNTTTSASEVLDL